MSAFHFILMALACYRLTVLIVRDAGPWDVCKWARRQVKMLGCPYCVSVWVGGVLETFYYFTVKTDAPMVAACLALALSSVAIILDRCFSVDYTT